MTATFRPPPDAIGADLVYWREDGHFHSLITFAGALSASIVGAELQLTFALFDANGSFVLSWGDRLKPEGVLFVDSREITARFPSAAIGTGTLAVFVSSPNAAPEGVAAYRRAYPMVDWFSDSGELVSLHSDQALADGNEEPVDWVEMVFRETLTDATFLVVLNGPEVQPSPALTLTLRNAHGDERNLEYDREMQPFTAHVVRLRDWTDDLVAFCGDQTASIRGRFAARGLFTRPYVFHEGARLSGYHGGNRYDAVRSIPRSVHRTLPYDEPHEKLVEDRRLPPEAMRTFAQKQMNPAYAAHGSALTTRIHLFQSHGDVEDDFFVDMALYDRTGACTFRRERCAIAPRHGVHTLDIAELTAGAEFDGYVAMSFSDDAKPAFPAILQALMEYRTEAGVSRTMLWSDRWNAPDRLLQNRRTYRALYRAFFDSERETSVLVTNPGCTNAYDRAAPFTLTVLTPDGAQFVHEGHLPPHGTERLRPASLLPEPRKHSWGLVVVTSTYDLASMQMTHVAASGVVAVEHMMGVPVRDGRKMIFGCGY